MRQRQLLIPASIAVAVLACGPKTPANLVPIDAGLVRIDDTGDGATLWIYGELSSRSFKLDSLTVVPARLASRSPDPDEFRVILIDAQGEPREVVHLWSPLGRFDWDSAGVQESLTILESGPVAIPAPVRPWLASVRFTWPPSRDVATFEVLPVIKRFCADHPKNPGCRG